MGNENTQDSRYRYFLGSPAIWAALALGAVVLLWNGAQGPGGPKGEERNPGGASLEAGVQGSGAERGVIGEYLEGLDGPPLGVPKASPAREIPGHLETFYRRRDWKPAWFDEGWFGRIRIVPEARDLLDRAREAEAAGEIRPGSLGIDRLDQEIEALSRKPDPRRQAEVDVALSWTSLHLLSQLAYGPVIPQEAGIRWEVAWRKVDLARALERVLEDGLDGLAEALEPRSPRYRQLKEVRDRYRRIAENGGWPRVPEGPVLQVGEKGDPRRLAALRRRLAAEGFLGGAEEDRRAGAVYDRELADAVRRFQSTRSLKTDGLLGPETRQELNVPAERRLGQLELNLARWRWIPDSIWDDAIVVNIPGYHLWRYEDGESRLDMDVVVGKPSWPTPVFSDEVEYLVLNPPWNVPVSIVRREILPSVREDPSYLIENNMVLLEGWGDEARVVDSSRLVELADGEEGGLYLQQRPGPTNPLGTIKFMFPNRYNVYLHDTAARALFGEADRNLSHGCVRVAKPYELAADLMRKKGWSPGDVRARLGDAETKTVSLPRKVPVHLLYWTAEVRPDGTLHFYEDIYGLDRAQEKALKGER